MTDGYWFDEAYMPAAGRAYGWFPPPPESRDRALHVGADADEPAPYFTDVRQLADPTTGTGVWLLTGRTTPWTTIWDTEHGLTVS